MTRDPVGAEDRDVQPVGDGHGRHILEQATGVAWNLRIPARPSRSNAGRSLGTDTPFDPLASDSLTGIYGDQGIPNRAGIGDLERRAASCHRRIHRQDPLGKRGQRVIVQPRAQDRPLRRIQSLGPEENVARERWTVLECAGDE